MGEVTGRWSVWLLGKLFSFDLAKSLTIIPKYTYYVGLFHKSKTKPITLQAQLVKLFHITIMSLSIILFNEFGVDNQSHQDESRFAKSN